MQKVLGSTLVLFACVLFGYGKSRELTIHIQELEELRKIFVRMKSEFVYAKRPLADICNILMHKTEGIFRDWLGRISDALAEHGYDSFLELWEAETGLLLQELHLSREEADELRKVGMQLGCVEAVELYLLHLEQAIHLRKEIAQSKKKLYQSMGILGGVFLVILLL